MTHWPVKVRLLKAEKPFSLTWFIIKNHFRTRFLFRPTKRGGGGSVRSVAYFLFPLFCPHSHFRILGLKSSETSIATDSQNCNLNFECARNVCVRSLPRAEQKRGGRVHFAASLRTERGWKTRISPFLFLSVLRHDICVNSRWV